MLNFQKKTIVILDFGGQYTRLIAKCVRDIGVYSHVFEHSVAVDKVLACNPAGIIFSGSPHSINDRQSPKAADELFSLNIPILGICYGLQYIAHHFGGTVTKVTEREYGNAEIFLGESPLYKGLGENMMVWMSHGDAVVNVPSGFCVTGKSVTAIASMENAEKKIYCLQYHPEVHHTGAGKKILTNFIVDICQQKPYWEMEGFIEKQIEEIREKVGNRRVVLALSGGVDSSVLAVLLHRALGGQLSPVFIDNGLLRKDEAEQVVSFFREKMKIDLVFVDAKETFLSRLKGVDDPEQKRKIIGKAFVDVFWNHLQDGDMLAQGTLYTDVIESVSTTGPSTLIKTHHNRVKEILNLQKEGRLLEPFATLFKDEVREIGRDLDIPQQQLERHPFPGPGLAVRILGEVTPERLNVLRRADFIFIEELKKANLYRDLWQCFCVLLPIRSVGVLGDARNYGMTIVLRAVEATDGMTADFYVFDKSFLSTVSNRIVGEIEEIARVVLDVTSKPPATIEWE